MINKRKVLAFVDNVLVETETEKEHNKIVEKVLKKLEENNLYVKPEKCMQKVQKIRFLVLPRNSECSQWSPQVDVQEELDGVLVGLQPYLYYYYSGCTLESYGHMSFPECSMVT